MRTKKAYDRINNELKAKNFIIADGVASDLFYKKLAKPQEVSGFITLSKIISRAFSNELSAEEQQALAKQSLSSFYEMASNLVPFIGTIKGGYASLTPLIKVPSEIFTNKIFYTGAPLLTDKLRNLPAGLQYKPTTNKVIKKVADIVNETTGKDIISPIVLEHVIRGFYVKRGYGGAGGSGNVAGR